MGEYLACGLAVVATTGVGDLDDHFRESDVAITVSASDEPARIVDRIIDALAVSDQEAKARELAEKHYGLRSAIRSFEAMYRDLGVEPWA